MSRKSQAFVIILVVVALVFVNYNFLDKKLSSFLGNSEITGGIILTNDLNLICSKGYTTTVRDVPQDVRLKIYEINGVSYPQPRGMYELDHVIPLELGGGNGIGNLQLEARDPRPGSLEKDRVENYLHKQVCSRNMDLEEARNQMKNNWTNVYFRIANASAG